MAIMIVALYQGFWAAAMCSPESQPQNTRNKQESQLCLCSRGLIESRAHCKLTWQGTWYVRACHKLDQDILRFTFLSQHVQAPCCHIPTTLVSCSSTIPALTSCWTKWHLALPVLLVSQDALMDCCLTNPFPMLPGPQASCVKARTHPVPQQPGHSTSSPSSWQFKKQIP